MNVMPSFGVPVSGVVDVVDVGSAALQTWRGRVEAVPGQLLDLMLEAADAPLSAGAAVVLDWHGVPQPRMVATVIEAAHPRYRLHLRRQVARDRRVFPRVLGGIALRYQRVAAGHDLGAACIDWVALGLAPNGGLNFEVPDPLMNFSVNGLRFKDDGRLAPGDCLLCEVGVLSQTARWRTVATVARRAADDDDEPTDRGTADGPGPQVALRFSEPPEGLVEALAAYTLSLQRRNVLIG